MSQENVELVRRHCEAHARGDFTAVFAAYDPEIEWHVLRVADFGFDPVYVGHEGVRTFWRLWLSAWETTFEYDEFIDSGEHVVVVQSQRMRARTSGIELEWNSYAQLWTIQDGKVVRMEFSPLAAEPSEPWDCGSRPRSCLRLLRFAHEKQEGVRPRARTRACYGADVSRSS